MPILIIGGDSLRERLASITGGMLPAIKEAAEDAMSKMELDAKRNCPIGKHAGGSLRESIKATVDIVDGNIEARLSSPLEYAVYVEMGTGPKGEANHAGTAPVGATYHATGWVYHDEKGFHYTTGQPARPFMYPAYKANKQVVVGKIMAAIRKTVKGE